MESKREKKMQVGEHAKELTEVSSLCIGVAVPQCENKTFWK